MTAVEVKKTTDVRIQAEIGNIETDVRAKIPLVLSKASLNKVGTVLIKHTDKWEGKKEKVQWTKQAGKRRK